METIDTNSTTIPMKEKGGYKYYVKRSGQPRRYADSEYVVEVYLPEGLTTEEASDIVRSMGIGFDDTKGKSWYEPKLSYFYQTSPGVWEFNMVSAYTD